MPAAGHEMFSEPIVSVNYDFFFFFLDLLGNLWYK